MIGKAFSVALLACIAHATALERGRRSLGMLAFAELQRGGGLGYAQKEKEDESADVDVTEANDTAQTSQEEA